MCLLDQMDLVQMLYIDHRWYTPKIPALGGGGRDKWISQNSKPAMSTKWIPGQPGLYNKILSWGGSGRISQDGLGHTVATNNLPNLKTISVMSYLQDMSTSGQLRVTLRIILPQLKTRLLRQPLSGTLPIALAKGQRGLEGLICPSKAKGLHTSLCYPWEM